MCCQETPSSEYCAFQEYTEACIIYKNQQYSGSELDLREVLRAARLGTANVRRHWGSIIALEQG
jgi:hypothetical protein